MKKFFYSIFFIFIFLSTLSIFLLSTIGLETSKFNSLIIKEIENKDPEIKLKLEKIKIKLDLKIFQLFLSTYEPRISYQDIKIPITEVKIYSKLSKILNTKKEVSRVVLLIKKFEIKNIKKIAVRIKPSNFKTYLLNNIEGGEIEKIFFDLKVGDDFKITDYHTNGIVKNISTKLGNNVTIEGVSFNFKIDKNLTLINSIKGNYQGISISNGSVDLQNLKDMEVKGKFSSNFNVNENQLKQIFTKVNFFKKLKIKTKGTLLHEFDLRISKNYKIIDYNYKSSGKILQSKIIFKKSFKNNFIEGPVENILFKQTKLKINFNKKKKNSLILDGLYSTDSSNYKKFKIKNNLNQKDKKYLIDLNLSENIIIDIINFQSNSKKISNLKSEFNIKNNKYFFKSIDFSEEKNSITVKGLVLDKQGEIEKITSIDLITFNGKKENNNLRVNFKKKISITGKRYDTSNLINLLSGDNKSSVLKNFSNEVEVKLKNLITKSQVTLKNFNLIGSIEKGKFNKISSKGEFSEGKYLDISLRKNKNNKKILEIYSDSPRALLNDYKFFEGIKDGKLLYNSTYDETGSVSKITIENFKVIKAPTFATLLTLADLGGVADLLSGKGMSFDVLEISLKDDAAVTTVEDLLALGTSVSLQMDGYIEKKTGLISLSGTLVPAKTLNNLVSKIPILGNILVGDKLGEGIFGVSFKMKGLPDKIKTTVNPVKTLTPRFITRALEKRKKN